MRRVLASIAVCSVLLSCSDSASEQTLATGGMNDGDTADADIIRIGGDEPSGCSPGDRQCTDGYEDICGANGLWVATNNRGDCQVDPCAEARRRRSYLGCEYWPVDLDNAVEVNVTPPANGRCEQAWTLRDDIEVCSSGRAHRGLCDPGRRCPEGFECRLEPSCVLDAQGSPFAVVVSNPSTTDAVSVSLSDASGQQHQQLLNPGEIAKLFPGQLRFADRSVDRSSQGAQAYRLVSDAPIVAYQFNPLDNVGVFSNDGSLLIPEHALDTIYYVLTFPTLNRRTGNPDRAGKNSYNGYLTVVGTSEGATSVRVTPTAAIELGPNLPALPADEPVEFVLNQGEVLNLEASGDGDLTGTKVESVDGDTTFAMFVGHEATIISDLEDAPNTCCADHIEEQLFPASTWGRRFAVARTQPRGDSNRSGGGAPDLLRVLAQKAGTQIRFDPDVGAQCPTLDSGEFCDVFLFNDTTIDANLPVLVGHFLLSTDGAQGDPALAFAPPSEQFRQAYTFLVPDEYDDQFVSIVSPVGGTVELDGQRIDSEFSAITGRWSAARVPVGAGQHTLTCPESCGLLVYGYSPAVSYLFAGGLDLEAITVP